MKKLNSFFNVLLSVFCMFYICSSVAYSQTMLNVDKENTRVDTLILGESTAQVLKYKNGALVEIYLYNDKDSLGDFVPYQIISFHKNGVISSIEMCNNIEIISNSVNYQENRVNMSETGILESALFMGNHKVLVNFSEDSTKTKR